MENKNYYEWLEISKNASPEVIEKAYKALVKKYHPDLQEGESKKEAEEIIKHINEAYEVLSDAIKREEYDHTLQDDTVSKEDYDKLKQELNNVRNNQNYNTNNIYYEQNQPTNNPSQEDLNQILQEEQFRREQEELEYRRQVEAAKQKAYHDAYIQDLKNRGYKIKYKKSFKDYLAGIITIAVIILVFIILWYIPPTHNWFVSLYESNPIIKIIVDIFRSFIHTITSIFE